MLNNDVMPIFLKISFVLVSLLGNTFICDTRTQHNTEQHMPVNICWPQDVEHCNMAMLVSVFRKIRI